MLTLVSIWLFHVPCAEFTVAHVRTCHIMTIKNWTTHLQNIGTIYTQRQKTQVVADKLTYTKQTSKYNHNVTYK